MDKLLSDSAKTEVSYMVMDSLRAYHISNWHSEPYHQNQNPAEWRYRAVKSWTNSPSQLLALMPYTCVLPSHPHSLCSSRWQNTPFCLNLYSLWSEIMATLHLT